MLSKSSAAKQANISCLSKECENIYENKSEIKLFLDKTEVFKDFPSKHYNSKPIKNLSVAWILYLKAKYS